jgi:hypothetical protein
MLFIAAMDGDKESVQESIFTNLAGILPLPRVFIYADDAVVYFKPER